MLAFQYLGLEQPALASHPPSADYPGGGHARGIGPHDFVIVHTHTPLHPDGSKNWEVLDAVIWGAAPPRIRKITVQLFLIRRAMKVWGQYGMGYPGWDLAICWTPSSCPLRHVSARFRIDPKPLNPSFSFFLLSPVSISTVGIYCTIAFPILLRTTAF
jgi:hypothetical protein